MEVWCLTVSLPFFFCMWLLCGDQTRVPVRMNGSQWGWHWSSEYQVVSQYHCHPDAFKGSKSICSYLNSQIICCCYKITLFLIFNPHALVKLRHTNSCEQVWTVLFNTRWVCIITCKVILVRGVETLNPVCGERNGLLTGYKNLKTWPHWTQKDELNHVDF